MKATSFTGVRLEVETRISFDEVIRRLRDSVGHATLDEVIRLAGQVANAAEYDRIVNERFAKPSGFILFAEVDHGAWLSVYGIHRRTVRWILGNPTLAVTMIRHDPNAGLFVPVELLVTEQPEDRGTSVLYLRPSSLVAVDATNLALAAAVRVLDEKLAALVDAALAA